MEAILSFEFDSWYFWIHVHLELLLELLLEHHMQFLHWNLC